MRGGQGRSRISAAILPARAKGRQPASIFAALGDENRLQLISRLSGGPASIVTLTVGSGISRQAVTKHLRVLAGAGLVRGTRSGRQSMWALERKQFEEARRSLDQISRQWDQALGKLKLFVER
jgi:DNA-binding transcriptional ArsR family regulator